MAQSLERAALASLLSTDERLMIVRSRSGSAAEVASVRREAGPSVTIIDLQSVAPSGFWALTTLAKSPRVGKIVAVSASARPADVARALGNGATAFVGRDARVADLRRAVFEAAAGRRFVAPSISLVAVDALVRSGAHEDLYDRLTPRQREVIQLAAEGSTNESVAHQLTISPRTVEIHRSVAMRKLRLGTQTDLVLFAVRRGLLTP